MHTCLYECVIRHQRLIPRGYKFKHHSFMFMIDLDEISLLDKSSRLFGHNHSRLYNLRDDDHLPGYTGSIRERLFTYLSEVAGIAEASRAHRIMLLTNLRFFDYVFNPVSFFYCFDQNDEFVYAVAEVGNTFAEKKLYFVPPSSSKNVCSVRLPKEFYVSPFSDLHLHFEFRLTAPSAQRLGLGVNEFDGDEATLVSSVEGQQKDFSDAAILKLTLKYPLVTLRVISMIHFHALILFLRGFHFFPKHNNVHLQTSVLNPHSSLKTDTAAARVEAQKG